MASKLDTLTHEQLQVVHHLLKGHNIFLTGSGGVGKSYLLSVIYNEYPSLKKKYDLLQAPYSLTKLPRIQITAMTGCAALLLGNKAKTLHSWSGIRLGKGTVNELFVRIRRSPKAMRHWLCTDLLIIDEVSMLTAELLDKLNNNTILNSNIIKQDINPMKGILSGLNDISVPFDFFLFFN